MVSAMEEFDIDTTKLRCGSVWAVVKWGQLAKVGEMIQSKRRGKPTNWEKRTNRRWQKARDRL